MKALAKITAVETKLFFREPASWFVALVLPALEAGATGYLLKDAPREDLVRAVRAVVIGQPVLSSSIASRLIDQLRSPSRETLSPRELEILKMVATGAPNREVARMLFISEATVKTHLLHT